MASILHHIKQKGIPYTFKKIAEKLSNRKVKDIELIKDAFSGKGGLELGGPSRVFEQNSFIPIYPIIQSVDGCNFSNSTLWEGDIKSSAYQFIDGKEGIQFISEATNLEMIEDEAYDFVISSHCLEHIANPMKAVEEWLRVIKKGGHMLLVLPNQKYTFDHKRPITSYTHLVEDYKNGTAEDDLSHLDEILQYHDLNKDPLAGTFEQFKERSLKNFENRALHQHVFSVENLKKIYNYFNIEIISSSEVDDHLIIFGKKNS